MHKDGPAPSYCLRYACGYLCFLIEKNLILFNFNEGLNITEVAHDYQATIKKYVEELGMMNSYDTWHGMAYICFYCVMHYSKCRHEKCG